MLLCILLPVDHNYRKDSICGQGLCIYKEIAVTNYRFHYGNVVNNDTRSANIITSNDNMILIVEDIVI